MTYEFDFERLDVYRVALGVARWMPTAPWQRGQAHLRDQGVRAAQSMVLNLAEGVARRGQAGRNHLSIALASAGETLAVLDLVDFAGADAKRQELRRVGAMLARMMRR